MKLISIVTGCYNEANNVTELYEMIKKVMMDFVNYDYETIFIDNASTDNTLDILKEFAKKDNRVKIIVNSRNFGHVRSPYHAFLQARGDAVIVMASDLQDPPELLKEFIIKWEEGYKVVIGVKETSAESGIMLAFRNAYYKILHTIAELDVVSNFTGFGLYDRKAA